MFVSDGEFRTNCSDDGERRLSFTTVVCPTSSVLHGGLDFSLRHCNSFAVSSCVCKAEMQSGRYFITVVIPIACRAHVRICVVMYTHTNTHTHTHTHTHTLSLSLATRVQIRGADHAGISSINDHFPFSAILAKRRPAWFRS
jgi:hypothetical protein